MQTLRNLSLGWLVAVTACGGGQHAAAVGNHGEGSGGERGAPPGPEEAQSLLASIGAGATTVADALDPHGVVFLDYFVAPGEDAGDAEPQPAQGLLCGPALAELATRLTAELTGETGAIVRTAGNEEIRCEVGEDLTACWVGGQEEYDPRFELDLATVDGHVVITTIVERDTAGVSETGIDADDKLEAQGRAKYADQACP